VIASDQSAVPVSAAALPLPTGAATSTDQTNGSQKTQVVDGSGNVIGSTSNALNVNVVNGGGTSTTNLTEIDGTGTVTAGVGGTLAVGGNQTAGNNISANTNPMLVGGSDYGTPAKLQSVKVDASGNAQVAVTNSPTVSVTALPAGTNTIGGVELVDSGGTNKASISASGAVKVDGSAVTQPVSGTLTANVGTTNGLALDTSVNGLLVAQGSTTSGQKGPLAQGAVTTSAPSYTTAQTSPLSLDTTGNLRTSVNNTVTVSGTITTTPPSNASTNISQVGGSTVVTGTGASGSGIPRVTVSNDSNVLATQSGTWTVQPGNTANTTPWLVSLNPATSGGWSVSSQTAFTNTVVSIKASAGQFGGYMFNNPNSGTIYLQIFNVASGSVTPGTTTPTYVIPLPAGASANVEFANGIAHSTAISAVATTTATGNTAPTTSLVGFFLYK
jgi:hypothetical protein